MSATDSEYRPRQVEAKPVRGSDLDSAADVLARAFHEDPTWAWAFPDPAQRPQQLRALWGVLVGAAIRRGSAWMTPGCTAVSVWVPPGEPELEAEDEDRMVELLEDMLGEGAERVFDTMERFEDAHPHDRGPHHYLSLLGTDPDHAGGGLGMGLVAAQLVQIDRAGAAAYLESTNPLNGRRYERLGFSNCGGFDLREDGPRVTQMWRDPR